VLIVVGVIFLCRHQRSYWLGILLAPLALGLVASGLGRYPFGGSARTMQYAAPAICILAGLGAARLIERRNRPRLLNWGVGALVIIGVVPTIQSMIYPYKMIEDEKARAFAKRFWVEQGRDGELACLKRDLGVIFTPKHWELDRSAVYLCNQRIYSPRHRAEDPLPWDQLSRERPLRVVLYNEEPRNTPKFEAWLARMDKSFEFRGVKRFVPVPLRLIKGLMYEDRFAVYEFVPKMPVEKLAQGRIKAEIQGR
jgi:hypothetical protein